MLSLLIIFQTALLLGCSGQINSTIRLVGSNSSYGRLQIFVDRSWKTVPGNGWTPINTHVACKELGFIGGVQSRNFQRNKLGIDAPINSYTFNCAFDKLNLSFCETVYRSSYHNEDVFLSCFSTCMASEGKFQCANGNCISNDLRCDFIDHCADESDELFCPCNEIDNFKCKNGRCIKSFARCNLFDDCGDSSDEIGCDCQNSTYTLLQCNNSRCYLPIQKCNFNDDCGDNTDEEGCSYGSIALYKNRNYKVNEGQLVVKVNGTWGTVNNNYWNSYNTRVACQELGFANGKLIYRYIYNNYDDCDRRYRIYYTYSNYYYYYSFYNFYSSYDYLIRPILLNNVNCTTDNSSRLLDCPHLENALPCLNYNYPVFLKCYPNNKWPLRLVGGNDHYGRLQVNIDGNWSTVYSSSWSETNSRISCQELGFQNGDSSTNLNGTNVGTDVPNRLGEVRCDETDTSLIMCSYSLDGYYYSNYYHYNDVFLHCHNECNNTDEFECNNGQCLFSYQRCNLQTDCWDGSDEANCTCDASENKFLCNNSRCIQLNNTCNMYDDCYDGSDEYGCRCNESYQFRCNNGKCIRQYQRCDFYNDCRDMSDEANCSCNEQNNKFQCTNGRCVYSYYKCNMYDDCGDTSDETNCSCDEQNNKFQCTNGKCVYSYNKCNMYDDCGDNSDETNCTCQEQDNKFRCNNGKCIYAYNKCDLYDNCGDNSDEEECICDATTNLFLCANQECIRISYKCNGYDDCGDGSDEVGCVCSINDFSCPNGRCIPFYRKCDLVNNCGDWSDEIKCSCNYTSRFQCLNNNCVPQSYQCDFKDDCGDGSDEAECVKCIGNRDNNLMNYCISNSFSVSSSNIISQQRLFNLFYYNYYGSSIINDYYKRVCRNYTAYDDCVNHNDGYCDYYYNNFDSHYIKLVCDNWEEYKGLEKCWNNATNYNNYNINNNNYVNQCTMTLSQKNAYFYNNQSNCSKYTNNVNSFVCPAYVVSQRNPECGSFEYLLDALLRLDTYISDDQCLQNKEPICTFSSALFNNSACNGSAPNFSNVQLLGPFVKNRQWIEFVCTFQSNETSADAKFFVSFLFDGLPATEVPTNVVNGPTRNITIHEKDLVGKLGKTLSCEIQSAWSQTLQVKSLKQRNKLPFFLGVTASKKRFSIHENQTDGVELEYTSTLPITCPTSTSLSNQCILRFSFITGEYMRIKNDNNQKCSRMFQENIQSHKFEAYSTSDIFNMGYYLTGITAIMEELPKRSYNGIVYDNLWSKYIFPMISVDRYDCIYSAAVCTSSGDPRVVTFDGAYFSIYQSGQFVYVKSTDNNLEVQIRHWPCISNVACVCGVAIREGGVILAADMCTESYLRYFAYPSIILPSGFSVQRSAYGDSFELNTPSGKIYGSNRRTMLSIQIYVSSQYRNFLEGLCGNYDGKSRNDLQYRNKTIIPYSYDWSYIASKNYVDQWRIARGQSLFNGYISNFNETRASLKAKPETCKCKMSSSECAVETNAAEIVGSNNLYNGILYPIVKSSPGARKKRSAEDASNISDFGYDNSPDDSVYNFTWPTKSGITENQARNQCLSIIWSKNALNSICITLPQSKIDQIVEKCVQDVQVSDVLDMAADKIPELLTICQLQIAGMPISTFSSNPGSQSEPNITDVFNDITPGNVSQILKKLTYVDNAVCQTKCAFDKGNCFEELCQCHQGFIGSYCSMAATTVPIINGLRSNKNCDVRDTERCRNTIQLNATQTSSAPNDIQCHYNVEKLNPSKNTYDPSVSSQQNGIFDSNDTTYCPQPDDFNSSFITSYNFSYGNKFSSLSRGSPVLKVTLKLSNGVGQNSAENVTYYIYDSLCYDCASQPCAKKSNLCVINGYCFDDQSTNPDNSHETCKPSVSISSWTPDTSISTTVKSTTVKVTSAATTRQISTTTRSTGVTVTTTKPNVSGCAPMAPITNLFLLLLVLACSGALNRV